MKLRCPVIIVTIEARGIGLATSVWRCQNSGRGPNKTWLKYIGWTLWMNMSRQFLDFGGSAGKFWRNNWGLQKNVMKWVTLWPVASGNPVVWTLRLSCNNSRMRRLNSIQTPTITIRFRRALLKGCSCRRGAWLHNAPYHSISVYAVYIRIPCVYLDVPCGARFSPFFYSPGVQDSPSGKDAHGFGIQGLTLPAIQWVEYCLRVGLCGQRMAEISSRRTKGTSRILTKRHLPTVSGTSSVCPGVPTERNANRLLSQLLSLFKKSRFQRKFIWH